MGTVYSEEGTSKVLKAVPGLREHMELPDCHPQAAELSRDAGKRGRLGYASFSTKKVGCACPSHPAEHPPLHR